MMMDPHGPARFFWEGPLFARLTKRGKDYLSKRGWQRVDRDRKDEDYSSSPNTLALVWPSKSGPQCDVDDASAPSIRPYPKHMTDFVDDKLGLAQLLEGSSSIPPCINSPEQAQQADDDTLYFVKHRYGAQGKSVYVYNQQGLVDWYAKSRNSDDFVIQKEILPSLYNGRKFVLRSHILLVQRGGGGGTSTMESYLYKKIVCQHHASLYENRNEKASQISQAGKKHPPPLLLEELSADHPAANVFPLVENCSTELVQTMTENFVQAKIGDGTTCFALLGTDLLLDEKGIIKICEVNSHPALGWGAMAKVPADVFATLIEETLSILIDGFIENKQTSFQEFV
jgi:hypothetical protein